MEYLEPATANIVATPSTWEFGREDPLSADVAATAIRALVAANEKHLLIRAATRIVEPGVLGMRTKAIILKEIEVWIG